MLRYSNVKKYQMIKMNISRLFNEMSQIMMKINQNDYLKIQTLVMSLYIEGVDELLIEKFLKYREC